MKIKYYKKLWHYQSFRKTGIKTPLLSNTIYKIRLRLGNKEPIKTGGVVGRGMTLRTVVGHNLISHCREIRNYWCLDTCTYYIASSSHNVLVTNEVLFTSFSPFAKLTLTTLIKI